MSCISPSLPGLRAGPFSSTATALESFRLAGEIAPKLSEVTIDHARLLRELGRIDEASAVYEAAVTRNPGDATLRLAYGNFLLQAQRYPDAHEQLTAALSLKPNDARSLAAMGFVKLRLNDVAGAVVQLQAAVAVDANNALAHFHLADLGT